MPTVAAQSSGVILSRGKSGVSVTSDASSSSQWVKGKGVINVNCGIGSVVEDNAPVEEISLEGNVPHRTGFSVANRKNVPDENGGLTTRQIVSGTPILTDEQILQLKKVANNIESVLGDQPHGWDIEWAIDLDGHIIILQARPNM